MWVMMQLVITAMGVAAGMMSGARFVRGDMDGMALWLVLALLLWHEVDRLRAVNALLRSHKKFAERMEVLMKSDGPNGQ